MTRRTYTWIIPTAAAIALSVLSAGCSHQAGGGNTLDQQRAGVMGSPAPPEVQKQVAAQLAAQQAARQAAQQAAAKRTTP